MHTSPTPDLKKSMVMGCTDCGEMNFWGIFGGQIQSFELMDITTKDDILSNGSSIDHKAKKILQSGRL